MKYLPLAPDLVDSSAAFPGGDTDAEYRYLLRRIWDASTVPVLWVMCNPSTASASVDDPTVQGCQEFARRWGAGGIVVANIFAVRSPYPKVLKAHPDPIGPDNDRYLEWAAVKQAAAGGLVIAAWGVHGKLRNRGAHVLQLLTRHVDVHALRITKEGQPWHPLYVERSTAPVLYRPRNPSTNEAQGC